MPIDLKQDSLNVIDLTEIGVSLQAVEDKIIILVDEYKSGFECKTCHGKGRIASTVVEGADKECSECRGRGQILHIPQNAQSMPSTGVIVSMGPATQYMIAKRTGVEKSLLNELYPLQIGSRVIFGVHVGTKIPIKGNIKLTIMREKEPLALIFGSDLGDKEIIDYTQENT
jgi:co-chaperonin GroES (HSP10)